jgi:hypothetical protein
VKPSLALWFLSWLTLAFLAACKPAPAPKPVPADAGECLDACHHLKDLGCPEAEPTPAGVPCEVWLCKYAATEAGLSAGCVHRVASCSEVDTCGRLVATVTRPEAP